MATQAELLEQMRPLLVELAAIADGDYNVNERNLWKRWFGKERGGWLYVESNEDRGKIDIASASDRTTHNPHAGKYYSVSFTKHGSLEYFMEAILTLRIKWDHHGRSSVEDLQQAFTFVTWLHKKLVIEKYPRANDQ